MDSKAPGAGRDRSMAPPPLALQPKKRHRSVASDGGGDGEGGRKRQAHSSSSATKNDPAFASAHRIPLAELIRDTPASEESYVAGSVVDVRQYNTESRAVTLIITDSSTHVPLKIFLRGSWASVMPRADAARTKVHVLLKGVRWEAVRAVGGMRDYAAVFEAGVRLRVRGEGFDGFEVARKLEQQALPDVSVPPDSSMTASPSTGGTTPPVPPPQPHPLGRDVPDPIASSTRSDSTSEPTLLPADTTQTTSDPVATNTKRVRSSSPGPSTSSKRHQPSGLPAYDLFESDGPDVVTDDQPQAEPSTTPIFTPPPHVGPHASASRAQEPISLASVPSTDTPDAQLPPPPPSFASSAPRMRRTIVERVLRVDEALSREENKPELDAIVDGLIDLPSEAWSDMLVSERVFDEAVFELTKARAGQTRGELGSSEVAQAEGAEDQTDRGQSGQGIDTERQPSPVVSDQLQESVLSNALPPLEIPPLCGDDQPGPSRSRSAEPAPAPVDDELEPEADPKPAKAEAEEMTALLKGFETMARPETRTPAYRYHSVSEARIQPYNKLTAVVGLVGSYEGPRRSSKDHYVNITLYDPSGEFEVRIFAASPTHLPSGDQIKVGNVFMLRETPHKKYKETSQLVAGSFDKRSLWACWDENVETLHVQPNRPDISKDLVDSSRRDPAVRAYAEKLVRWKVAQSEPVVFQPRGRPTLRVEEIQDEKQFFNCVVQVIKSEARPGEHARTVYVTDWTSNPLLDPAPMLYERGPTVPFGQHTLIVSLWNDLVYENSSLQTGRLVKLHNLKPRLRGDHWEATIYSSDGGRIERLRSADPQVAALLARREAYVQLGVAPAQPEAPAQRSPIRAEPVSKPEPAPDPAPTSDSAPVLAAAQDRSSLVEPEAAEEPTVVPDAVPQAPLDEADPLRSPVASAALVDSPPPPKGKEPERITEEEFVDDRREDAGAQAAMEGSSVRGSEIDNPTQGLFYDLRYPNGSSLQEIVSSDRLKFRTRARIADYHPKALEDVVVATCDRCDVDLPATDKRCRGCNDVNGDYTTWRYRLVLTLSDGTAAVRAAVFDEDMYVLFPFLPPASDYHHSPTNPMVVLADTLARLVSFEANEAGPLLDLSIRKFRVRGVTGVNEDGWASSYRVFATVLKAERG